MMAPTSAQALQHEEAAMPDILHRVGIDASTQRVFEAIATIDFGFCRMQVADAVSGRRVRWRCVEGPEEWVGTEVTFDLAGRDDQTFVLFRHAGWKEPVEFMHHCSTKWTTFLLSLRDLLEKAKGSPAPRDVKIHVGD
jgi:hypothetical protein